jgi:HEAT repeat protein
VLIQTSGGSITFSWIIVAAYLAAERLNEQSISSAILAQPRWELRQNYFKYLASQVDLTPLLTPEVAKLDEPLLNRLIALGEWSLQAPADYAWTTQVLRTLTAEVGNIQRPFGLRLRLAALLAGAENKSIDILFRKMMQEGESQVRFTACLGAGLLKDPKALGDLKTLVQDIDPGVRKSAVLALGAIGGKQAMESVAYALLQNDEGLQKCAAEVLASDENEGYETLREGSTFDDLLVRRAVISGLRKIDADWSSEILEKIRLEDSQWVVRNAAERALNQLNNLYPTVPRPFTKLQDTPWLVKYASTQGRGISSSIAAEEVLLNAAQNGNYEEKKLAFYRLVFLPNITEGVPATLYRSVYGEKGEIQEEALQSLWLINGRAFELPEPMQFGYA